MSYSVRVCDAADDKESSGVCDGMLGMHRLIPPVFNGDALQIFLRHIHYSHLHGRLIHGIQMVLEVKLSLSESDYARTTCIIMFLGGISSGER